MLALAFAMLLPSQLAGQDASIRKGGLRAQTTQIKIPKIEQGPKLEDFLEMQPSADWKGKLAQVEGFIQRAPDDGKPATQLTEVFFGYDQRNLYVIFVAHDREPSKLRARLDRREAISLDEDQVGLYLDTFDDRRRAYQFACNALGMQDDSLYSEDSGLLDESFDTVWSSRGKTTSSGYVVWMSIPFKSLRFAHTSSQTWRVAVWRWIGRRSEGSWWPRVTFNTRGILSQAASATGLENISPGRNLQFIPYVFWRAFHGVDNRDPAHPAYDGNSADIKAGLDSKIILRDSLVLDLTANPDFSQVESDDPQTTVNQRYEVFFPEKRPFFTENSSYFDVPIPGNERLLFTRRIADPDFGARLTGRLGHYSIGGLFADDRSPGEQVLPGNPLEGQRAYFDVLRITRDLPGQSNFGGMYTERRFAGSYSGVLDFDTTLRLDKTWTLMLLYGNSWNHALDSSATSGHDFEAQLLRQGRGFNYALQYIDRSPDFVTNIGFFQRNDKRRPSQDISYKFWPQNRWLTGFKPELFADKAWDFRGTNIYTELNPSLTFEIKHQTTISLFSWQWRDKLRPKDFSVLTQNENFREREYGLSISSNRSRWISLNALYAWGSRLNYIPPAGQPPTLADYSRGQAGFSFLTSRGLTVMNAYLLDRNVSRFGQGAIYNSHIFQSKWSLQFNRELSVRFIAQYNTLLTNPVLTSTPGTRKFNADFLITYLVHPGTAIYVGYNSNLNRPGPPVGGFGLDRFVNDGRQVFIKASYLFRF